MASQVGEDMDNYDVVLKYISEADLMAYGATPVEGEVDEDGAVANTIQGADLWGAVLYQEVCQSPRGADLR